MMRRVMDFLANAGDSRAKFQNYLTQKKLALKIKGPCLHCTMQSFTVHQKVTERTVEIFLPFLTCKMCVFFKKKILAFFNKT